MSSVEINMFHKMTILRLKGVRVTATAALFKKKLFFKSLNYKIEALIKIRRLIWKIQSR